MHYRLLIGFYGGMFIVSLGLGYAFELFDALPSWITGWSNEASLWALIVASFSAALMLWLSGKVAALYELYRELSQALPTRDWKWNLTAGLASGFVEEFAFRGVALALVGPFWSSIVFGLLHLGWKRSMWLWPIYAALIGWALAYVTEQTGSIWAAVIFHAVYNAILLQTMDRVLGNRK